METITRASLEDAHRTGGSDGEVNAEAAGDDFHGRIADAVARGDQVVHVDASGRETPLTSRDGRTVRGADGAGVGWMGVLSHTGDRVEIRPGERSYGQTAGEPVARITGEEIAPRTDDLKTLRAKARQFYADNLRGTSVRSEALGRDVEFRGSRKPFNSSANPDKLRLFAALPDVIAHGELVTSEPPRTPAMEPSTRAYHYLQATVEMDGKPVRVGVTIREDAAGNLYYNHNPVEEAAPAATAPEDTAYKAGPGDAGSRGGERNVGAPEGGVNPADDNAPAAETAPDGASPGASTLEGAPSPGSLGGPPLPRSYEQGGTPNDGINLSLSDAAPGAPEARGRIDFSTYGTTIRLFKARNLSTFLHESGHQFLDELTRDAADPRAPQQLRDDMAAVVKWLGVDHPDAIGVEQHEQFARGFEAYLLEGRAPSAALAGVFARFKAWLTAIYRNVAGLGVEVSPEVRQVMDRLLATDDELQRTRQSAGMERLFQSAEQAGMTDREFAAYTKAADTARDKASQEMLAKSMTDIRHQRTVEWRDQAASMREDVAAEVDARPEMQALELLRNGKPRGSDAEPVPMRMSRAELERMHGPGTTEALPRSVPPLWTEKGGVHPDVVAEAAGFRSGDEMVRALMDLANRQRDAREAGDTLSLRTGLIEDEVQRRMVERHGDLLGDGSIEAAALDALHNDQSLSLLGAEVRPVAAGNPHRGRPPCTGGRRHPCGGCPALGGAGDWRQAGGRRHERQPVCPGGAEGGAGGGTGHAVGRPGGGVAAETGPAPQPRPLHGGETGGRRCGAGAADHAALRRRGHAAGYGPGRAGPDPRSP